jgi:hypothetical protein
VRKANLFGGSEDPNRGKYCTPEKWAGYVGPWDLDAFTNSRSHIVASVHCMLDERGDNGFGRELDGKRVPGEYVARATSRRKPLGKGELARKRDVVAVADESTRVWIQPDYQFVDAAITHYGHTRFCALLKYDTRTKWFRRLTNLIRKRRGLIACPLGTFNFEPPPGVPTSSNVFPHALYYADERDVTDAVLRRCLAWRP